MPPSSLTHLEYSLTLYDSENQSALRYGIDSGVMSRCFTAWILWTLGYPDQALVRIQEACSLAQTVSHPSSLAFAMSYAAILHQLRREPEEVQKQATSVMILTAEHGLLLWEGWAGVPRGWALVELEEDQTGIADLQEGWALFEATGAEWSRSYYLALLADSYRKVGRTGDGLVSISEGLAHVEKKHERFHEVELYRLKGELLLNDERRMMNDEWKTGQEKSSQHFGEAEACFHTAIDIARSQEAKSWELRAVTSLARLWQQQGKNTEAHTLLREIYDWFTEGFDTADLQDAKVLLGELETQRQQRRSYS